jgi:hypothetical protein
MLHACVVRFDVTENLENFLDFGMNGPTRIVKRLSTPGSHSQAPLKHSISSGWDVHAVARRFHESAAPKHAKVVGSCNETEGGDVEQGTRNRAHIAEQAFANGLHPDNLNGHSTTFLYNNKSATNILLVMIF